MMDIAVIGSGSMGAGIAQVAATAGHQVLLFDHDEAALLRAERGLGSILARLVEKEKITTEIAGEIFGRIRFENDLEACSSCGMMIEAIIEDLEAKRHLFSQFEKITEENCILATNTSSLSIAAIAAACKNPGRVLGVHFFNPAPLMKLVEIVPAVQTDPDVTGKVEDLIKSWGKTTVLAKDTPGFIVNRVARPFYGEALRILEEGLADAPTIDWAMTELGGFRMGPFTLMDYIGNDVNYKVTETVFKAFYYDPRYKPSFTQKRLTEAGYLGRKSGRGFYHYDEPSRNPGPVKDPQLGENILWRILVMLINEAADALYLNIASREDLELAMTRGVNYPKGLLQWADETGISKCVTTMDRLYEEYREDRYRCSPLLRKMAREGKYFF